MELASRTLFQEVCATVFEYPAFRHGCCCYRYYFHFRVFFFFLNSSRFFLVPRLYPRSYGEKSLRKPILFCCSSLAVINPRRYRPRRFLEIPLEKSIRREFFFPLAPVFIALLFLSNDYRDDWYRRVLIVQGTAFYRVYSFHGHVYSRNTISTQLHRTTRARVERKAWKELRIRSIDIRWRGGGSMNVTFFLSPPSGLKFPPLPAGCVKPVGRGDTKIRKLWKPRCVIIDWPCLLPRYCRPSRRGKRTRQDTSLCINWGGAFSALRHRCLPFPRRKFMRDIKRGDEGTETERPWTRYATNLWRYYTDVAAVAINITATDRNFNRSSQGPGDIRPVERDTILISSNNPSNNESLPKFFLSFSAEENL